MTAKKPTYPPGWNADGNRAPITWPATGESLDREKISRAIFGDDPAPSCYRPTPAPPPLKKHPAPSILSGPRHDMLYGVAPKTPDPLSPGRVIATAIWFCVGCSIAAILIPLAIIAGGMLLVFALAALGAISGK